MADLLDQLLDGVPNVQSRSAPSVFGPNAVSFEQANKLTADRINTQSQLLETRNRFNQLRRDEQTLQDGRKAMAQLTQLDPANDPDYMNKVQGILAQNPNASLDAAVSNFLGVQQGIYRDAEADRDAEAALEERRREANRNFRIRRKQERILRSDAKADRELEEIEDTYDQMSPTQKDLFDQYSQQFTPKQAMDRVLSETQTASEINALLAQGITESEIFGVEDADGNPIKEGLVDEKGRIDPKKLALFMGERSRLEAQREAEESAVQDKRARLQALMKFQAELNKPENFSADEETKKKVADSISRLHRELGNLPSDDATPGSPDATNTSRKDVRESDRFFP